MRYLKEKMAKLEAQDKLGRWEIENREGKRVAKIYFKAKPKQHRKNIPRAPLSRHVKVQANDLHICKVSYFIDGEIQG